MEKKKTRRVDQWVGRGRLTRDGQPLHDVDYFIDVYQTFIIITGLGPDPPEEIAGLQDLRIQARDLSGRSVAPDGTVTLHLSDGRHIAVFHDGREFVAAGPMQPAGS